MKTGGLWLQGLSPEIEKATPCLKSINHKKINKKHEGKKKKEKQGECGYQGPLLWAMVSQGRAAGAFKLQLNILSILSK